MRISSHWRLAFLLLVVQGMARAGDGWAQLKLGMSAGTTLALLGEPLIRTAGLGFETWIYDHCAEVLFYGPLIGWTKPSTGNQSGQSVDVWQKPQNGADYKVHVLPRPSPSPPPDRLPKPSAGRNDPAPYIRDHF